VSQQERVRIAGYHAAPSPMRRLAAFVLALVALALAVLAGGFFYLKGRGLPRRSGSGRVEGLAGPVRVRFDRWAVPHVLAEAELDLAAALGYLHANDRMTQLELGRRSCAGRLAEVVGERALPADRRALTLRLRTAAERLAASAGPQSAAWLEAYARGVNGWLAERRADLPPELALLGAKPEPWTSADSLCFALLMARDLSFPAGHVEEARYRLLQGLGVARTRDLLGFPDLHVPEGILSPQAAVAAADAAPTGGGEAQLSAVLAAPSIPGAVAPDGRASSAATAAVPAVRAIPAEEGSGDLGTDQPALGSNDWAVGASRSRTGAPLVANDPHLPLGLPSTWYQVHLRAPGFEVAGMTLPGLPGVVIGQSSRLAWALTNVELDDHDLFFEELDAAGERVRRGRQWVPLAVETAVIPLRGGGGEEILLRSTDRGPLLAADPERGLPPRSLAWTAYEPADPLSAFLGLARARSVDEVPSRLSGYVTPCQNLVVADREGGLLYTVLGRVPERRRGDGRLPAPGWDPAYGWDGLRPRELNPSVPRPDDDLLVTANHDIRPPGYALPFFANFYPADRARRIEERLRSEPSWDAAGFGRLQTDVVSLYARDVVAKLAGPWDGDARLAYEALAGWDGAMDLAGPAALFLLVERELLDGIFGDEARAAGLPPFGSGARLLRLLEGGMDPAWFDDAGTPAPESRDQQVGRALARAWQEAVRRWGREAAAFRYGELHRLLLAHPLGSLPLLGRWLNRGPLAVAGAASSIAAFGGSWQGAAQSVRFGPSMRWVSDVADPDRSLAMLPGGQSGHPADPHYADQVAGFFAGTLRPLAWSEEAIAGATASVLVLEAVR
jgi:penicillin amidase